MRVYEAAISYNLVQQGRNEALTTPEKTVEYMKSAFAQNPLQEASW